MTAADRTPIPATDGLREAVEALRDEYTRRHRYLSQTVLSTTDVLTDLHAILAAHPAPPSETATEGVTRVEWGSRVPDGTVENVCSGPMAETGTMYRTNQLRNVPGYQSTETVRRMVTEFAPIVGEWEPVEEGDDQ